MTLLTAPVLNVFLPAGEVVFSLTAVLLLPVCRTLRRRLPTPTTAPLTTPTPPPHRAATAALSAHRSPAFALPNTRHRPFDTTHINMANPFPSDWSLTSPKEDTAPPAKQLPFTIRTFSFRNALDYCASQIFSRFSTDADSPLPALEHSSSTRDSSPPSTPITPGEYTTEHSFGVGTAAVAAVVPSSSSSSAQSKRQRSQDELRSLSDSQLGLQLAILLPERMCASPLSVGVSEEEKTSCPPQLQPQGQRHARQRMTLRQSEGPSGAIPFLDLDAVQEVDEASSCRAAAPEAEVSGGGSSDNGGDDGDGDAMRLNAAAGSVASRSRGSRCELAESARRCVAPRDLLFS